MKKRLFNFVAFIFLAGFISCETKEVQPNNILEGEEYFPLEKGNFVIYKVKKINYSSISGTETQEYFLKEVIADTMMDGSDNISYALERHTRLNEADTWRLDSVWSARRIGNNFIKVENNIDFVKLVVPVQEGKEWNGNIFNSRGAETYKMEAVHQPLTINDVQFDSTLTQIQKNDSSSVSQDYRSEIYAKGVGLIYKKSIITYNRQENGSIVFPIEFDYGIDLTQTIIEYGKE